MGQDAFERFDAMIAGWPDGLAAGADAALVRTLDAMLAQDRRGAFLRAGRQACPAVARALMDLMPDGAAAGCGDLFAAMDLLEALEGWFARHNRRGEAMPIRKDAARTLVRRTDAILDRVKADLEQEDHPDLHRIGLEAVKLDLIRMLLARYGSEADLAHLDSRLALLGRLTLRRVTRVVAEAAKSPDLSVRLDLVLTLAHVDELLVLAERVLEVESAEFSRHPALMAERIGLDVVEHFAGALRAFAPVLLDELEQRIDAGADYLIVREAWFRKLRQVIRFCEGLKHPSVQMRMQEFSGYMRGRLARLEARQRRRAASADGGHGGKPVGVDREDA